MPQVSYNKNVGAYLKASIAANSNTAGAPALIIAGGAGDAVEVTGPSIDRIGNGSCSLVVGAVAALATAETLAFAVTIEDDDNAAFTSPASEVLQTSTVLLTDPGGGSNQEGVLKIDTDLTGKQRFIRYLITPDLSRASLDEATFSAVCVLGGDDFVPST